MSQNTENGGRMKRFGPFEADLQTQELLKRGRPIRLGGQSSMVLKMLLERAPEMVTREELKAALWPTDTFVDFEHGLNTAVKKLRDALSDSAENPKWIETLPRRGYRFIGEIAAPVVPVILVEPGRIKSPHTIWLKIAAGILATLACTAGVGLGYRWFRHGAPLEPSRSLTPLPFTALPGVETSPAFSPDGSRITFAWNGDPASNEKGFDLYVKGIGSETMVRLTQHPSEWLSPVWSSDGTQIAFHRIAGADTGIYIVPALGGPERKLLATHVPYAVAAPISWSPDGKWIAFGNPLPTEPHGASGSRTHADRIFLISPDTLETRPLPHDPKCRHESTPTFSHSGSKLAYVCVRSTNDLELIIIGLPDGAPKTVVAVADYMTSFAWAADDSKLVLSVYNGSVPELFEAPLADGQLQQLPLPPNAAWPVVSSKGDKVAYSASSDKINIWRKDLLNPDLPPVKLISSTQIQTHPQYSPDGKHIAFNSSRSGPWKLWVSDADGTNLVQLSNLETAMGGTLGWSPDSKQIVVGSKPKANHETYIVDISERVSKKLVTNSVDVSAPSWSHDGKWIYFRAHEAFGHKLYRCPAGGGQKILVSADPDSIGPKESSDGQEVYFAERELNALLMKVSLEQPNSELLAKGLPRVSNWTLWTIAAGGIYFVPADTPRSLCYFDFTTKQIREVFKVEKNFDNGLSVSPDGRWLLYSQVDEENSDIMLVDHFS